MIDDDDVNSVFLVTMFTKNPILSIILALIFFVVMYQACVNKSECAKQSCPNGGHAIVLKNECLCVTPATPTPTFSLQPNQN